MAVRAMAMKAPEVGTAGGPAQEPDTLARWVYAACLVLFPLLWGVVAGTGIHPDPSGETAAEQVRAVSDSAGAWQLVHLVLAGASLLGIGAVLGLRNLVPRRGRLSVVASVSAGLGIAAAGLVAGLVLAEAVLVAPVARACSSASTCLSAANDAFLGEFAQASWNDLTALSVAAGTLIFALGTLAVLGWMSRSIRAWEAALMIVGIVGIYAMNTVLHGNAKYGLLLVLVASASIALRLVRRRSHGRNA
jgi:hypothetical protein